MATRPSPRSSDGIRPRTKSGTDAGRPPSSPLSSDASRQTAGRSSASSDKPVPSFLRPTVSSSLHSSTSSSSLRSSSSSKGLPTTARRSADKAPAQPLSFPRPITPKEKAKAAPASTSRWSAVSPKRLMQKASNAIKATKTRSKASKEAAGPGGSSSGKEAAGPVASASAKVAARASTASSSSGKEAVRPAASGSIKQAAKSASASAVAADASSEAHGETARSQLVEDQHQQPEASAESPPAMQAEEGVLEPKTELNEQHAATSHEAAGTDITAVEETAQKKQASAEQQRAKSDMEEIAEEEKHILEEAEAMSVETPEQQEHRTQSSAVAETETEAQDNTGNESLANVVEEAVTEVATTEAEHEPATNTVEETVVDETKPEVRRQEEAMESEAIRVSSETSVVSEEPKEEASVITEQPKRATSVITEQPKEETNMISEQPKEETSLITEQSKKDPAPGKKQGELVEEAQASVASSATAPMTPVNDAVEDVNRVAKQVSASETVTPVQEAASKDKAVIETPATIAVDKAGASRQQTTVPEDSSNLPFMGSKVKTAMEERSEEEQPKKKDVARSNDVIEETKSKLLEKRKSKVKALVGAFETVMDSPHS